MKNLIMYVMIAFLLLMAVSGYIGLVVTEIMLLVNLSSGISEILFGSWVTCVIVSAVSTGILVKLYE